MNNEVNKFYEMGMTKMKSGNFQEAEQLFQRAKDAYLAKK